MGKGLYMVVTLLLTAIFALFGSCSGGGGGGSDNGSLKPVAEQYAIDGVVDLSAVGTVHQQVITMNDALGTGNTVTTTTLRWAATNDDRNLYIALEWDDATENTFDPASGLMDDFDGIVVVFSNSTSTALEEKADAHRLVMTKYGSYYSDLHVSGADAVDDAVGDGRGKMTWSVGKYHAEFLIPLTADAAGEDGVLNGNTRFNVLIYDHIQLSVPAGNVGALNGGPGLGAGTDTTPWATLPYTTPGKYDQPVMPVNLTGLIVFISDHENPKGELYTFDPATSVVTRVTHTTGLYLDGASLSHDRTRVAFFGAPTSTDFANFEIYTVNVDGSNLKSLTTNSVLDGHPGWSPDDSKIVYASFYAADKAKLIISSATGSELSSTLTPSGVNDNDPDWLPDGRIVFKTDRFGTPGSPQVRIAVMNEDGSNVTQVTNAVNTSDHDPTGSNAVAVFERFMKDTDYAHDPSFMYSPWNIIEARLDGSGERTLMADGWVNWLPVHDPTGQYLVYLKTVGYTDARLMDANGRDLGRLIPGITKVRYIDWK